MIASSAFASSPPHRYENVISVGPSASPPPPAQPLRATIVAVPTAPGGAVGVRQNRFLDPGTVAVVARQSNRIANRVETRVQTRLDRHGLLRRDATQAIEEAQDRTRTTGVPR